MIVVKALSGLVCVVYAFAAGWCAMCYTLDAVGRWRRGEMLARTDTTTLP